jgi:hypothetical protein
VSLGWLLQRSLWRNGSLVYDSVVLVVWVVLVVLLSFYCVVCCTAQSGTLLFNIIGSSPVWFVFFKRKAPSVT